MSRYINANAFEVFGYNKTEGASEEYNDGFDDGVQYVLECIDNVPTADVVAVVRCKDCIYANQFTDDKVWCSLGATSYRPNDFCSYGERRTDGSWN